MPKYTIHRELPLSTPSTFLLNQVFEERVALAPHGRAVVFEDQQLTYEQLNQAANQLAHYLQSRGVRPEVTVGLAVERSLQMIVAILAIFKAGGIYLPLDPTYPQERLRFMMQDAHVSIVVTQHSLLPSLPTHAARSIVLDHEREFIAREKTSNLATPLTPEHIAYIIYTSGSTGKPKGVMVPHRGICNLAETQVQTFGVHPQSRILQFASLSFDASIYEIIMALLNGATLYLAKKEDLLPGPDLIRLLERQAISIVTLPPSVLAVLPEADLPALDCIISAGEICSAEIVSRWGQGRQFFNAYGPTEATVCATVGKCIPDHRVPSIGRPLANTQISILDPQQQPLPVGAIGEIYIGGIGVAQGYLNRSELTRERFISNPFASDPEAKLYRTGDLARYQADGTLEFIGRIDEQVKIRGHRIEPNEIEAVLQGHPDIQNAVVVAQENKHREKHLVSYILPYHECQIKTQTIRQYLQEHLPNYMLPATIIKVERFPLMPNGKIDRKALSVATDYYKEENELLFVASRTSIEATVATIWAEVLGQPHIGIHDNFFELGGHSLLIIQIVSRLRQTFMIEIPMRCLFDAPTVEDLAKLIETNTNCQKVQSSPYILPGSREKELPVTFSQEQVWFLQQLNHNNIAYNSRAILRFTGILNRAALEQSFNEMLRRHEILRTTFPAINGQPIQRIHATYTIKIHFIDLQTLSLRDQELEIQQQIQREAQKPFDLTQLPLLRLTLLRLHPELHLLIQVEHHLIHDGWSFNVLLSELLETYKAFSHGKSSPLLEPAIQLADYAIWQRQWIQGREALEQQNYWKNKLADYPPVLNLPLDHPRPAIQSFQGKTLRTELDLDLCKSLRMLSQQGEVTLFMTLLTAFLTLLYRYSRQDDLCIGVGVANRRWKEAETLIGMIINTVVLRTDMTGNPTFRELLSRVREVTLDAYMQQDFPFSKVVESLRVERNLRHNPLYQVIFGCHDAPLPDLELPGLSIDIEEAPGNGSAKLDLNVIAIPRMEQQIGRKLKPEAQGITLIWEYNTDIFEEATINRMIKQYHILLNHMVNNIHEKILHVPMMTDDESKQLLEQWNGTDTFYPRDTCVHEIFERWVQQRPDAIAVVYGDESISYQRLNQQANQLAHHLRTVNVTQGASIGIYMERSIAMLVGILGILKVGAAYLPLDLTYPRERLAFMIQDAQTPIIVTKKDLRQTLPEHEAQEIYLDRDWSTIAQYNSENPANSTHSNNIAYILYTSGSTGLPKGVCIPHSAINRLVINTNYIDFHPDEIVAHASNTSFDAATFEIWGALLHGARLIIIPKDLLLLPQHFAHSIHANKISTLFLTTALFNQFANEVPGAFHSIRNLLFGGETADPGCVREILRNSPPERLIHVYGPTESTTYASWYLVEAIADNAATIPIGRPISNTQIFLLNEYLQPVPIGVPGEIYIGGDGLAIGYLNQPELTDERFIHNPFSKDCGKKLYRTGDLARSLPDGNIEFIGRVDQQVKIRGFRIEPGEVEAQLRQHSHIQNAVVIATGSTSEEKRLVAYVACSLEEALTEDEIYKYLKDRIPAFMIPSAFMLMQKLPLTPNGKIDRGALPLLEQTKQVGGRKRIPPRNTMELRLANVFEDVLGIHLTSVLDDFFALGGHSLLTIGLIARIQEQFGQHIPLSSLFQGATVEHLAYLLQQNGTGIQQQSPLVKIRSGGSQAPFFCIHSGGGRILHYMDLAYALSDTQPFYAIEESFFQQKWTPCIHVEDMARSYIREIRTLQPHGPYFLGGHSFGGTIAFEMANLLLKEGEEIALLTLFDTLSPLPINRPTDEDETMLIDWYARRLVRLFSQKMPDHLLPSLKTEQELRQLCLDDQYRYLHDIAIHVHFLPENIGIQPLRQWMYITQAHIQAAQHYTPGNSYPQKITLFRATECSPDQNQDSFSDHALGWDKFTAHPIEIHFVPGNHGTMMEPPHVQVVANLLSQCIDKARKDKAVSEGSLINVR